MNQTTGELVTLVTDLVMGEGQDVTLPPGTLMSVKVKVHISQQISYLYSSSKGFSLAIGKQP